MVGSFLRRPCIYGCKIKRNKQNVILICSFLYFSLPTSINLLINPSIFISSELPHPYTIYSSLTLFIKKSVTHIQLKFFHAFFTRPYRLFPCWYFVTIGLKWIEAAGHKFKKKTITKNILLHAISDNFSFLFFRVDI